MRVVTSNEFRANQNKYFDLAEQETVFVARENARPIIIKVAEDDDMLSLEELQSIQQGLEDLYNGKTYEMRENENLDEFLNRIEKCIK